ncbi:MAG: endo-1,4-beta-xylanase [Lachnospiraceae bacterium]|nr:endo-1,4-beta-xylanase [Lachnospiraceae bacterium]
MKKLTAMILGVALSLSIMGCGEQATTKEEVETTIGAAQESTSGENNEQKDEQQENIVSESRSEAPAASTEAPATPTDAPSEAIEIPFSTDFYDYESMADLLGDYGIRFGAAMSANTAQDYTFQALVGQHFNSVTATNEMKAYCLLDAKASRKAKDGMPVMDFSGAAGIMEAAMMNGAQVRGHVLVWDAHMTDWFFREGYKSNGDYVDRETMKKRMESYITQVITYYEENYPGVVYCWDVVNEAVGDGTADYVAGDDRHVRIYRSGGENLFYKYVGEDYVELAFLYARNAVEALQAKNPEVDIKLYYNDYNTFYEEKRDAICTLVESINSFATDADGNPRKLCDGVGMQGYIGGYGKQSGCMDKNNINMIKKAIEKYAALGVEVQLTEMAVRNYNNEASVVENHANYYAELMKTLVELNSGEEKPLTGISIWGLTDMAYIDKDSYSYKMNGPYCGLFTPGYEVKEAFHKVYVMLKEKQQ